MRDSRRLGQAGRAGGVDIKGRVAVGQAFARRLGRAHRRPAAHGLVQAATVAGLQIVGQAENPERQVVIDQRPRLLDLTPAVLVRDDVEGLGDGQAVGQPLSVQIGVDQGRGDTDLGEADPRRQILDPVGHHQGDGVAATQAPVLGPVGEAVRHGVQVAIGQGALTVVDGDVVGELVDRFFKVVTEQDVAVQLDRLDAFQQTEQAAREPDIPADIGYKTHARRTPVIACSTRSGDGRRRPVGSTVGSAILREPDKLPPGRDPFVRLTRRKSRASSCFLLPH